MKLSFILFFIGTFCLYANTGYAQDTRVRIHLEKASLTDVFREIEKQSDYRFFYNNAVVSTGEKFDLKADNESISILLNNLFRGTDINYQVVENYIVITHRGDSMDELVSKAVAQQVTITGTVTDEAGEPMPGVNVVIKGTTTGVITGFDGRYTIRVSGPDAVLIFSFMGYMAQELLVGDRTVIDIFMEEDARELEEVVIVGYGSIKRQAVTGAVAKANLDAYKDVPSNNIMDRIKGSVAGLNVEGTNRAGAVGNQMIRGQNSVLKDSNGNTAPANQPLIVVDGAIFAGSLADISPYDVESLTVLKDASAAAVYGSRSANGVILIETKRGAGLGGKPVFNLNVNYGISNQLKKLDLYGPEGYLQRILDIREARDMEADPSKIEMYMQEEERKNYNATPDHRPTFSDPYSITSQTGYNRNLSFSVSNQMEKTRYYISTSLIDQRGIELNDEYKYLSARVNIDSDISSWLNVGVKSFYSHRDNSGEPPTGTKTSFSPWATLKDENGRYMYAPQTTTSFVSPFWRIPTDDVDLHDNLNAILTANIKIPWVQGLTFTTTLSNTLRWDTKNQFWDSYTTTGSPINGRGTREKKDMYSLLWDNIIKYNRTFKEKHFLDVTLLFSQEKYKSETVKAEAEDFDNQALGTYRLQDGKTQKSTSGGDESEALGLMARATYTYNNKYSVTGTIRRDGYSGFSKNKKYGTFASGGINWNISRESFMKDISFLDNLAIRATYGSNGNQSISMYQTLAKIATDKYIYAGMPSYVITQYINSLANDHLGWESTTGLNFGIDFGWLNSRINGSIDMYWTKTNDLLFSLDLPRISGMGSITSNVGEIKNRGIEISLNTLNIDRGGFRWYTDFAFSLNRNKVVSIFGDDNDGDGKEDDLISAGYFIGEPLETMYGYKVIGMYQQEDVDNGTIMQGWRPGEYIIEDLDNSGTITSDKDRQILGNKKENFRWSLTNTFQYKGISLMFYLYSIWGGNGWYLSDSHPGNNMAAATDVNCPVYDYWTPRNTGAHFQRPEYGRTGAVTAYKPVDRSFIKLQKISLTYDVGQWIKSGFISDLVIGVSADNLFTIAPHWIGLDPETNQGIIEGVTPSIRTYNFSVALKF